MVLWGAGRMAAAKDDNDFVVFLIGSRWPTWNPHGTHLHSVHPCIPFPILARGLLPPTVSYNPFSCCNQLHESFFIWDHKIDTRVWVHTLSMALTDDLKGRG
jgi:hypothetical protein